jgi:hypothetical protein
LTIPVAIAKSLADAVPLFMMLGLTGMGLFGFGALRLPRWAQNRARQMEGVAARLTLLANSPPTDRLSPPDD